MFRIDDSDDSGSEDEINILEPGQHDIVLLHEKPGTHGLFRSKKHHPMFPYHEEKVKLFLCRCFGSKGSLNLEQYAVLYIFFW